jgi:hypothetical protein
MSLTRRRNAQTLPFALSSNGARSVLLSKGKARAAAPCNGRAMPQKLRLPSDAHVTNRRSFGVVQFSHWAAA